MYFSSQNNISQRRSGCQAIWEKCNFKRPILSKKEAGFRLIILQTALSFSPSIGLSLSLSCALSPLVSVHSAFPFSEAKAFHHRITVKPLSAEKKAKAILLWRSAVMLACLRERTNLIEKTQQPKGRSRFLGEGAVGVLRQGEGLQELLDWIVTHEKNVKEVSNGGGRLHCKQMLFA